MQRRLLLGWRRRRRRRRHSFGCARAQTDNYFYLLRFAPPPLRPMKVIGAGWADGGLWSPG